MNIDAVTARLCLRIFLSKIIGISPKYRCEYWEDSDLGWAAKPHRDNVMTKYLGLSKFRREFSYENVDPDPKQL